MSFILKLPAENFMSKPFFGFDANEEVIEMEDKTFYVQIKKKKLLTNLRLNDMYPKQRLISEIQGIVEELNRQPDDFFY